MKDYCTLLGEFKDVKVEEVPLPQGALGEEAEVRNYWKKILELNPRVRDLPKIRITALGRDKDTLILKLSKGVSYANVMYSEMLRREYGVPKSPIETYEIKGDDYCTRSPFSNILSIACPVLFDPNNSRDVNDEELKALFTIRSKHVTLNPNTLDMMVNGAVEEGEINDTLITENILREAEEEAYLKDQHIEAIHVVGPVQSRGRGAEMVYIIRTGFAYKDWKKIWLSKKGQEESSGVVAFPISEIDNLFSYEGRQSLISRGGLFGSDRVKMENIRLGPISKCLPSVLNKKKLASYL